MNLGSLVMDWGPQSAVIWETDFYPVLVLGGVALSL